jgi:hypothetical protein
MKLSRLWPTVGLLVLVAASGCIFSPKDDDGDTPPPPAPSYRAPTHPDSVTLNFRDIYADMNIDAYRDMLHPDYKFILKPGSGDDEFYNYDTEVQIHDNIFASRPGGPDGTIPPITGINIVMNALGAWQAISPEDANFGGVDGQWRQFNVEMVFTRPAPATTFIVEGESLFYVIPVQVEGRTEYRLYGIVDRTTG